MEATSTWVNFYAKDYGGWARVRVKVYIDDGDLSQVIFKDLDIPLDTTNDKVADKWQWAMVDRWIDQYGTLPLGGLATVAQAWAAVSPGQIPQGKTASYLIDNGTDAERKDPDGRGPLVNQIDIGDGHTVLEEYRGYILDGGGLDGSGQNGHPGGHVRIDPARKELLTEVDRGFVIIYNNNNNMTQGELKDILNGASRVFSHSSRGAGIYMYYVIDEEELDLPLAKIANQERDVLAASRDTPTSRATNTPNLKTDFVHLLYVNQRPAGGSVGADSFLGGVNLDRRGTVIAIANMRTYLGPPPKIDPAKFDEFIMTTTAHELTHQLLRAYGTGAFDKAGHTINANGNATNRDIDDENCLMYDGTTRPNCELASVKYFPVVQAELRVRTNWGTTL